MKKVLSILILVLLVQSSWAQRHTVPLNLPNYDRKPVHFGFLLGINSMDFKITPRAIQADTLFILKSQEQKGFNLGIVSNFRLGRNAAYSLFVVGVASLFGAHKPKIIY